MLDTNSIIAKAPVTPMAEVAATATTEKASTNVKRQEQQQAVHNDYSSQTKKDVVKEQETHKSSKRLIDELNQDLNLFNTRVAFSVDERTNKTLVQIIDNESNDVIRQVPAEYLLEVSQNITELIGLLVDEKV
jgi:flagellar protein FlaG